MEEQARAKRVAIGFTVVEAATLEEDSKECKCIFLPRWPLGRSSEFAS